MNAAGRRMHERKLVFTAQENKCADCGTHFPSYSNGVVRQILKDGAVEKMICFACSAQYPAATWTRAKLTPAEARAELARLREPNGE